MASTQRNATAVCAFARKRDVDAGSVMEYFMVCWALNLLKAENVIFLHEGVF